MWCEVFRDILSWKNGVSIVFFHAQWDGDAYCLKNVMLWGDNESLKSTKRGVASIYKIWHEVFRDILSGQNEVSIVFFHAEYDGNAHFLEMFCYGVVMSP